MDPHWETMVTAAPSAITSAVRPSLSRSSGYDTAHPDRDETSGRNP